MIGWCVMGTQLPRGCHRTMLYRLMEEKNVRGSSNIRNSGSLMFASWLRFRRCRQMSPSNGLRVACSLVLQRQHVGCVPWHDTQRLNYSRCFFGFFFVLFFLLL